MGFIYRNFFSLKFVMPFYENSEFADQELNRLDGKRLFDDTMILGADRTPCIICGHPTGDCTGESGPPTKIAGFGASESLKQVQTFLVEDDIYEDRQITPFMKVKFLLHKKGKQIPYKEAERLGLL